MASNAWTPAEEALAEEWFSQGKDAQQISELFGAKGIRRTHQSIRRKKQREGWHARIGDAPSCAPRFDQEVRLKAERVLIMPDPHVPYHDGPWCNRVINLALSMGVDTVAVPGDLVDFTSFAKWGRQERVEAEDEIREATRFVRALARTFDRVVYSGGNHEMRLPRITGNLLELRDAMAMFVRDENVTVTDYHWFELVSGGERFYVEHPKNASTIPGRVPTQLAAKFSCHVIASHGHQWGQVRDVSGRYWCIDSGVCCDPPRLAYISKVHSTRPQLYQGAVLVIEGTPILLGPGNIGLYERMVA